MAINVAKLNEQLARCRYRDGRWERLENGEWVAWPVLKLDRLALRSIQWGRT